MFLAFGSQVPRSCSPETWVDRAEPHWSATAYLILDFISPFATLVLQLKILQSTGTGLSGIHSPRSAAMSNITNLCTGFCCFAWLCCVLCCEGTGYRTSTAVASFSVGQLRTGEPTILCLHAMHAYLLVRSLVLRSLARCLPDAPCLPLPVPVPVPVACANRLSN